MATVSGRGFRCNSECPVKHRVARGVVSEAVIMKICGWETREVFERHNVKDTNDVAEAVTKREQIRAENSHDFSHDLAVFDQTAIVDGIAKVNGSD
jgi:hypothetical protein